MRHLPEGELHSRAPGTSPYDLARDDRRYPFARIFAAAELASSPETGPDTLPQLQRALRDPDSAARYWAALGFLMRGPAAIKAATADLQTLLGDASSYVRIAAAWALVDSGDVAVAAPALAAPALAVLALAVLGEHAPWGKNDVFVSMAALTAIDRLGAKAAALHAPAQHWPATGPLPDARYAPYVPQLIKSTAAQAGTAPPVRKKKKV